MNILILNYEFPPLGGGAGISTQYLLREFAGREDLQIDLVTSSCDAHRVEEFSPRIRIHYMDIGKKGKGLHFQIEQNLLVYAFKAYHYARTLIRREGTTLCTPFSEYPVDLWQCFSAFRL